MWIILQWFVFCISLINSKALVENESVAVSADGTVSYDFMPGESIEGYVLDGHITVAGFPVKQRYWNHFPILNHLINSDINFSSHSISTWKIKQTECLKGNLNDSICLDEYIFKGGHGDIWRAHKVSINGLDDTQVPLILKRMKTKDSKAVLLCALREIYFGKRLINSQSFPKLVTFFIYQGDYWLVFEDEGSSLQSYLYNTGSINNHVFSPSRAWRKLRTSDRGAASIKSIMFQLLSNVAELHQWGIIHRDIKPSNILLQASRKPRLLVSDFSSAVDEFTLVSKTSFSPLYDITGPSIAEETLDYAPPEVILSMTEDSYDNIDAIPYDYRRPSSFDIWSIGIVFLEILLGTPDVFHVDQRAEALIIQLLQKRKLVNPIFRRKAFLLAGLSDFGIFEETGSTDTMESTTKQTSHHTKRKASSFSQLIVGATKIPELRPPVIISSSITGNINFATTSSESMGIHEEENAVVVPVVDNIDRDVEFGHPRKELGPCSLSASKSKQYITALSNAILHRDILGIGFQDKWGLDLLARLLCFNPMERISLNDALKHAYFHGPYMSAHDGKEFATLYEMIAHNKQYIDDRMSSLSFTSSREDLSSFDSDRSFQNYRIDLDTDFVDAVADSGNGDDEDLRSLPSYYMFNDVSSGALDPEQSNSHSALYSAYSLQSKMALIRYECPRCERKFNDQLSCKQHMQSRRHGTYCRYITPDNSSEGMHRFDQGLLTQNERLLSRILPPCLSDRSLGLRDEGSGWCDLQGKRRYMEDFHSIHHHYLPESAFNYSFFGVFDGHLGSFAARYSAHHLHVYFQEFLDDIIRYPEIRDELSGNSSNEISCSKESVALKYAFLSLDQDLGTAFLHFDGDIPIGGSTATVLVFERVGHPIISRTLLVGHVGDSRLIFCNFSSFHESRIDYQFASQVTTDHSTNNPTEVAAIIERGGKIITVDGVPRVEGELIVTRSLGDSLFSDVLSSVPDILSIDIKNLSINVCNIDHFNASNTVSSCGRYYFFLFEQFQRCVSNSSDLEAYTVGAIGCRLPNELSFAILASDGLWDVMGNEEAVSMVCDYFLENPQSLVQYLQYKQEMTQFSFSGDIDEREIDDDEEEFLDLFQAASRLLAYEALMRGSVDNIGVSVIDLSYD